MYRHTNFKSQTAEKLSDILEERIQLRSGLEQGTLETLQAEVGELREIFGKMLDCLPEKLQDAIAADYGYFPE